MMKKTITGITAVGFAVLLMGTGCSSNTTATPSGSPSPGQTAPASTEPPTNVEVPPAVASGAKWCTETYQVYMGSIATPAEAAAALSQAAKTASDENKPEAATALTNLVAFLNENQSATELDDAQAQKFTDLDKAVAVQFSADCGGKTIEEIITESQGAAVPEAPAPDPGPTE